MKIESYENFKLGNTIGFKKVYSNQLLAKKEVVKYFKKLKKNNYAFETKVLTIPIEKEESGLLIETFIPVKGLIDLGEDFCIFSENKIFSKRGLKVSFLNNPDNFIQAFSIIKKICYSNGINVKEKRMMELATLDKHYNAMSFSILLDLEEKEYADAKSRNFIY
ncbi:hypothetical protein [Enterococcus faecalis]|uniref:hypothetical protein n=1 Tax=Enterococcus faecalis TaxID=1351 RepID=UPI002FBD7CE8